MTERIVGIAMASEKRKFIIDRIPEQFCDGPFWGNGTMGAVLYVEGNVLHFSLDHVRLWEMRESLEDRPRATYQEITEHPDRYLAGDPDSVAPTDIFESGIGRTRLPGLTMTFALPGGIAAFRSETDLSEATTRLVLRLEDGSELTGTVCLNSCVNVLHVRLEGPGAEKAAVRADGWDLSLPALRTLKRWNYPPCVREEHGGCSFMKQRFSGDCIAVAAVRENRSDLVLDAAAALDAGPLGEENGMAAREAELLDRYLGAGESFREAHLESWRTFWSGFDVTVPNARLQEAFDLEMFKLFCNERPDSLPVTLQGVWNPDRRMPAWFGDLHNDLNVQACYWAAFKTGNAKLARPYVDTYSRAVPRFRERAEKFCGVEDAVQLPTMMAQNGFGAASEWCFWNTLLGPELFAAVDFCWYFEYTGDLKVLKEEIYPFLCGVANLYRGVAKRGADGLLHIPFTQTPEVFRNGRMLMGPDSTFAVSSLRYVLEKLVDYSSLPGMEEDASRWIEFERELVPVRLTEKGYPLFPDCDVFESHRHFCQLYPIFPLSRDAHSRTADDSLNAAVNLGFTEFAAFSFPYLAIFAARCGRGNMARTMLEIYCMAFRSGNSFTVNGDPYRNGLLRISETNAGESSDAFTLESGFIVPAAMCDMFVHRSADSLFFLAGIPDEWKDCSCRGITVEGGHSVSVRRKDYRAGRVEILPGRTETLLLVFPGNEAVRFSSRGKRVSAERAGAGYRVRLEQGRELAAEFSPASGGADEP